MAFSAIYDLVIDERDVRIYSNGTGIPVLDAAGPRVVGGQLGVPDRRGLRARTGRSSRSICPAPATAIRCAGRICPRSSIICSGWSSTSASEPIDLVGCGFGGYLAASVAAKDPQLIRRLVLENPTLPPRSGPPVSSRMAPGMAINGAVTTLRRGRIKQNMLGFARAKAVLEQLAQADPSGGNRCRRSPPRRSSSAAARPSRETGRSRPAGRLRSPVLAEWTCPVPNADTPAIRADSRRQ